MSGIVSYGAYLPFWRLQRTAITAALGSGGGKGTRAVASYDEDTTSMGVEAARIALRQAPADAVPADVLFATTSPAYADKTNATAIHAALALPTHVGAYDLVGAVRSNVAACTLADRLGGAGRALRPAQRPARAARRSRRAATAPRPCSSATVLACWPRPSAVPRPPASSSTAGAARAKVRRSSGRSASASSPTPRSSTKRSPRR